LVSMLAGCGSTSSAPDATAQFCQALAA